MCTKYIDKGAHVYVIYGTPEFDRIAINNLS